DPLHRHQRVEPRLLLGRRAAVEPDQLLAHDHLDVNHRFMPDRRQRAHGLARAEGLIHDTVDVDMDMVVAVAVDHPLKLADHALTLRAAMVRWWAWQMAMASASAASA